MSVEEGKLKKKGIKKSQTKSIKIEDSQLQIILEKLTEIHNDQKEDIVRNLSAISKANKEEDQRDDLLSKIIRIGTASLFIGFGIMLLLSLILNFNMWWGGEWQMVLATILSFILATLILLMGISIFKIKSKTYLMSVFSALVALAALIVALLK